MNHLREDPGCVASTMVDYYALPQEGPGGWPGRAQSHALSSIKQKAMSVQKAVRDDLAVKMGRGFDPERFVPFVVMHEFEGLLFSDCAAFSRGIGRSDLEVAFQAIRADFATPEEINDSPVTAPSKRLKDLVPSYEKPLLGVLAVLAIGLPVIREECPHFNDWLEQLESFVR